MPYSRITASDPAVLLVEAEPYQSNDPGSGKPLHVQIKNKTGTASIFIGDDGDVDFNDGFEWEVSDGNIYETELPIGGSLYGFAAIDQDLHVLVLGAIA